jgi:hypothetical protein
MTLSALDPGMRRDDEFDPLSDDERQFAPLLLFFPHF